MQRTEGMFNFYVDLHRVKQRARALGHTDAIVSLQHHYPEIFEEQFEKKLRKFLPACSHFKNGSKS
jgi:hypothetical protein